MSKQQRRHSAEQIVKMLRDADAMLAAGKSVGATKGQRHSANEANT